MINPRYTRFDPPIETDEPVMAELLNAPAPSRARGRPKGTGIDDGVLLGRIGDLLRVDPFLKSTTAIKRLGISDASIIRRLRNKMKSGGKTAETRTPEPAPQTLPLQQPRTVGPDQPPTPTMRPMPAQQPIQAANPSAATAETEQDKRTRNALLLAAYLEALAKSAPQLSVPPAAPDRSESLPRDSTPAPISPAPEPTPPTQPRPQVAQSASPLPTIEPPAAPFNFPGMPPFLQPFRQAGATPGPLAESTNQLAGLKLAVEAMTSMTRLQLHITENAMAYSPMALMLQGQAFIGQMLLASFTGQLDATKKKPTDIK